MTHSTQDLRDTMRTVTSAQPPGLDPVSGVVRQARQQRQRRWLAGGGAVIVTACALVAVTFLGGNLTSTPPTLPTHPSPSPTSDTDALPTYLRGGKLIASREAVDARGVTMTFTPTSRRVGFVVACSDPSAPDASTNGRGEAHMTVDGKYWMGTDCIPSDTLGLSGDADFGRGYGSEQRYDIKAGQPVTVRYAFADGRAHPGTRWRLAAYQMVPLAQYPFPSPPAHLVQLHLGQVRYGNAHLVWHSSFPPPATLDGTSVDLTLHHGLSIRTEAAAPGSLRIYVNGRLIDTSWSWTYGLEGYGASYTFHDLGVAPGSTVHVTFRANAKAPHSQVVALFDDLN